MLLSSYFCRPHSREEDWGGLTNRSPARPRRSGGAGAAREGAGCWPPFQLVQAMAGFGGGSGAADSLTGPLGADTQQQPLLTTPQHA
jgi:hypothetical protein